MARKPPTRPMSNTTRSRLGGLGLVATHGPGHMATIGRAGMTALDRRIAAEAGIPDDLPEDDYTARLAAARRAYYVRMAEARWSKAAEAKARRIARDAVNQAQAAAEAALAEAG